MGVDFTAILDHRLSWGELYALPKRLNDAWQLPEPWTAAHAGWTWKLGTSYSNAAEELFEEGHVWLDGPAGFRGIAYKHAFEITHLARWQSFLHEPDVQAGLRAASRLAAAIVRAQHILYLPDSAFPPSAASELLFEGGTVWDAIQWLRSNVGPPLPDPAAFLGQEEDSWDERGWFHEPCRPT